MYAYNCMLDIDDLTLILSTEKYVLFIGKTKLYSHIHFRGFEASVEG